MLDRAFFSALGAVCLFIVLRCFVLSVLLFAAVFLLLSLWNERQWSRYKQQLWNRTAVALKRESWLKQEAERLRKQGGVILFPLPERDEFIGLCLRMGPGTGFHAFGGPKEELAKAADEMGCIVTFHPWGEGEAPTRGQIEERLRQKVPLRKGRLWNKLLQLPDNRYILTGCVLLLLSIILKRALYWRLLASLCLLIGAFRRTLHMIADT